MFASFHDTLKHLRQYPNVIHPFQDLKGRIACGKPVATPARASRDDGWHEEDIAAATQVLFFGFAFLDFN